MSKRHFRLLLFLAAALVLTGCESEDECTEAADCDDSDFCTEDRCRLGRCSYLGIPGCCHDDSDCGVSFGPRCETGSNRCVDCLSDADCESGNKCDPYTRKCGTPPAGMACQKDADCDGGWCLTEAASGFPGGFCGRDCEKIEDCASYACVDVGGRKTCLPICYGDNECRPEYTCLPTATNLGACFPHCTRNEDCPAVGTCNLWRGLCGSAASGGDNGAPCTGDADCKGYCATEQTSGAPGGVCVSICSPSKIACPGSDACVWQLSSYLGTANVCLPAFNPQVGCRPQYAPLLALTVPLDANSQVLGVCQPACRGSGDCLSGNCNAYSGLCDDPAAGADHGAACATHEDCRGLCLTFWPDGYCTGPCHPAAPDCPDDGMCLNLGILALCVEPCQSDPNCRPGYVCDQNAHACLPPP